MEGAPLLRSNRVEKIRSTCKQGDQCGIESRETLIIYVNNIKLDVDETDQKLDF